MQLTVLIFVGTASDARHRRTWPCFNFVAIADSERGNRVGDSWLDWDVVEWTRKHTANVHEGLPKIQEIIEVLVKKRDERKDSFASAIRKAMETKLGDDADEVMKQLSKNGIPRGAAREAMKIAKEKGGFSIFALVDALTQLSGKVSFAGDRSEADVKSSKLLSLAF